MCYVSAEGRFRDAREEEVLIVQRQPYGSNWLVSPDIPSTAVCLKDGTRVELLYIPEKTQRQFGFPREAEATFKMKEWWRRDLCAPRGTKGRTQEAPAGASREGSFQARHFEPKGTLS